MMLIFEINIKANNITIINENPFTFYKFIMRDDLTE